jgi:hypothetical protein
MQDALVVALSLALAPPQTSATMGAAAVPPLDSVSVAPAARSLAPTISNVYWASVGTVAAVRLPEPAISDQIRQAPAQEPVEYSDGHYQRLSIHRAASYAILPMFVAMYITGRKRLDHRANNDPPGWAKLHGPLAAGVGGLFVVNTVTGIWNLRDMRKDPDHRTRRYVHTLSMLAAEAGFATAGVIGASSNRSQRGPHRAIGLTSMAVATASSLMMLFWRTEP